MNAADADSWGRGYRVESILVVTSDVQRVEILTLTAEIRDDGGCEESRNVRVDWPFTTLYPERAVSVGWRWVRAPMHRGKGGRLEVYGTDHERVRKVFGDVKAMLRTDDAMRAKTEINRVRMTAEG